MFLSIFLDAFNHTCNNAHKASPTTMFVFPGGTSISTPLLEYRNSRADT